MSKSQDFIDFLNQEDQEDEEDIQSEESDASGEKDISVNIPLNGSPLYPRIYTGDSAKPLSTGLFPESEIGDDNITNTWRGIMSFYG
nr:hypothetical protein 50 [bacterium]